MNASITLCALAMAVVGIAAAPGFADDATATTGLERYAPHAANTSTADIDKYATNPDTDALISNLDATRAAIDRQTGSNIQLNVSGWVSQQVEVTRDGK